MYIQQSDLFRGMDNDFVGRIMELGEKEECAAGDTIFKQGDPAEAFYILLKGRVRLTLPKPGVTVHSVSRGGEAFAWSSLVGGEFYTATAECVEATKVLRFGRRHLNALLEEMPSNGMLFYRRLASALGGRLLTSYRSAYGSAIIDSAILVGTDQLINLESPA